jgi:hypothetical protein
MERVEQSSKDATTDSKDAILYTINTILALLRIYIDKILLKVVRKLLI